MFFLLHVILFSSFVKCFNVSEDRRPKGCQIYIHELAAPAPIFLHPFTKEILYPDCGFDYIELDKGAAIHLACPGSAIRYTKQKNEVTKAKCDRGKLVIEGKYVSFKSVFCSSRIKAEAKYTGKKCWGSGSEIEIGWQLEGNWSKLITICFDKASRNVLFSRFVLVKQIGEANSIVPRPSWIERDFYNLGLKLMEIYKKNVHRVTINRQLGLKDNDYKYVKKKGEYYIAKGHLTANADFVYNAQQQQTCFFVNSAPQWQIFNARNWFYFERNLRNYAADKLIDLEVYTGTYGITSLPHAKTGKQQKLYLYVDENGNKAIPIPELFWKVAYDAKNKAGIAVLGVNNPFKKDVKKSIICEDIGNKLTWLTFNRFKIEAGYMYACTIDDFRKSVPNLPKFDAKSILE